MTIFLIIGIIIGAIAIKILNIEQKSQIIGFFNSFFKMLNNNDVNSYQLLKQSVLSNFKTILIIWITGMVVIGIPAIPIIVILRGCALGFTVGFLVNEFGTKGFLFSLLAILPQNLFVIPGIISIASIGVGFSINNVKNKNRILKNTFFKNILSYSLLILFFSFVIFIGSIVEAYITPIFMKLIIEYIY
jgi:stage II sporulation protein M